MQREEEQAPNMLVRQTHVSISGPLPPPETLARYNEIIPDAAERILRMAEEQSAHRRAIEQIAIRSGARNSLLGILGGFSLGIGGLAAAVFISSYGLEVAATVTAVCTILALAGSFAYGSKIRKDERTLQRSKE